MSSSRLFFSAFSILSNRKIDNTNKWTERGEMHVFPRSLIFALPCLTTFSLLCGVEFVSTAGVFLRLHTLCLKRIVLILSPQFTVGCSFTFTLISVSMYHYGTVNNVPGG